MGKSRSVRVFLSSTFRDFGEERDLLVRKVFPALRAKLRERFVELVDVDLRWGITVEQAERGEVLPICLAEIDRSRPYFIGLLGERYGWVPGKEKYPPNLLRQRRWLKAHQGGKSVTELEILHGVLNAPEMAGRARFYFRSSAYAQKKRGGYLPVSKEDRQRQQELKSRIRQSAFPVVRYATPAELAKRLERDLWQILDAEFPAESVPDAFERESMRHEAYAAPRRRLFLGGDRYLKTLKALLRKNTPRILVTGQSGGGKSTLLANALVGMHSPRVNLFEHYLGASSDSADAVSLVRRLIDYIRRVTQSTDDVPSDPQALFESLPTWLAIASAYAQKNRTRWVFALDALNNLSSYQDLRWFPSYLPPRLSIVVSCLEGDVLEALEAKGPWERMTIDPLDRAGQERLLTAYLRRYNKTLPTDLHARALDHPLAGNPLWLKTLAEELRLFGSHEELERRLITLLGHPKGKGSEEPPTVDDLFEHVLERIEHDHGKNLVRNALTSIWASRAGLSEPELLEVLNCPPAIWAPIRYALDEMLLESGGRILFAHDYAKIAVRDRYLPAEKKQQQAHRSLAKYFASKSVDSRVVEELPHQWREAKAWCDLEHSLTRLEIFEALIKNRSREEHLSYWLSMEAAYNKQILEQSMRRAWRLWALSEHEERTADLAHSLAFFLSEAGRGITGPFVSNLAHASLAMAEKTRGLEHPVTAIRLNNFAGLLRLKGKYAAAETLYRRALAISEKVQGTEHPVTAIRLNNLGVVLEARGDYLQAEPFYRRALAISEKIQGPEHPVTAIRLNNLAVLLCNAGSYEAAESLAQRALVIAEKTQGLEHPVTAIRLNTFARIFEARGDYLQAEPLYRRALAISEKVQGPEHPKTGARLSNLARVLEARGDYLQAEPLYRRALAISEKVQGPEHPDTGSRLNSLAVLLKAQGKYAAANALYRRALSIAEKRLGPEHPDTGTRLNNLAMLLKAQGDCAAAEPLLRRALAIAEKAHGPEHPDTGTRLNNLAGLLEAQGDYAGAEPIFRRALAIAEKVQGPEHPDTGRVLNNLAGLLHDRKDYELAEPLYRRALAIAEKTKGPEHPATAIILDNLAGFFEEKGDYLAAESLYRRFITIRKKISSSDDEDIVDAILSLSQVMERLNRIGEAVELLESVLPSAEKLQFGGVFFRLGTLLVNQQQYERAESVLKKCLDIRRRNFDPASDAIRKTLDRLAEVNRFLGRPDDDVRGDYT